MHSISTLRLNDCGQRWCAQRQRRVLISLFVHFIRWKCKNRLVEFLVCSCFFIADEFALFLLMWLCVTSDSCQWTKTQIANLNLFLFLSFSCCSICVRPNDLLNSKRSKRNLRSFLLNNRKCWRARLSCATNDAIYRKHRTHQKTNMRTNERINEIKRWKRRWWRRSGSYTCT